MAGGRGAILLQMQNYGSICHVHFAIFHRGGGEGAPLLLFSLGLFYFPSIRISRTDVTDPFSTSSPLFYRVEGGAPFYHEFLWVHVPFPQY